MAIRDEFFEALESGAKWDVGVSINRSNPLPLDSNSVFKSYSDAETYAAGVLAYPGQVIAVVDVDKTTCYVLDGNKALQPVGSASSTTQVVASQEEMLALTDIEKGQMVYRTDTKTTWVFIGEDPSSLDDWSESASTNDTVWQGTENKVGFYAIDKSTYDGLESKDSSVLYFLTDTGKIFKGETDVTQAVAAVTDFGEATDAATSSELCIASHHGYTNSDFTDYLTITYQNKAINTLEVSIYFSADDFVIQNIQKQTNLVLSNFFGTELTEEQVTEQYNSLQNSKDKDEPVAVNQLQIGSYTAEINMQYIQDQDFYLVHYFLVPTEHYES